MLDYIYIYFGEGIYDFCIDVINNAFFRFIITGGGIFGAAKLFLHINAMRIISFIRIYKNKKLFLNHEVFQNIDRILKGNFITSNINDLGKKAIAEDLLFLEIFRIKQILRNNLKSILKTSLISYLRHFFLLNSKYIIKLYIDEYFENKKHMEYFARNRMTKNDYMSQEDFNHFWKIYKEYTINDDVAIYNSLNKFELKKNYYEVLFLVLDIFYVHIETYEQTIANKFNLMNGRLSGIKYKGFVINHRQEHVDIKKGW